METHVNESYQGGEAEFISNRNDGTWREVILPILPNICGILLAASTSALIGKRLNRNVQTLLEFIFIIVPGGLCSTILSDDVEIICLVMQLIATVNAAIGMIKNRSTSKAIVRPSVGDRPFMTNFRALVNVSIATYILAVHFRIMPRRYAKTEIYGHSLIDSGVGLFIVANALAAPESSSEENRSQSVMRTMRTYAKVCMKNSALLLFLGIGRFVMTKFTTYPSQPSEYGLHWNLLMTLAIVKLLIDTISPVANARCSLISGTLLILMHEYALNARDLKNWILDDSPENGLLSSNRDILCSVPGFIGLYLIGIAIGRFISSAYEDIEDNSKLTNNGRYTVNLRFFGRPIEFRCNDSMILCVKLSLFAVLTCAAFLYLNFYYGTSRHLANAAYSCWILTLSCVLLTLLLLVEVKTDIIVSGLSDDEQADKKIFLAFHIGDIRNDRKTRLRVPEILAAVDYNGLAFFIFANLLTGLINSTMTTDDVDDERALQIVVLHTAACLFFALLLYRRGIRLKL